MAKTIDSRVVEMKFNNKQFESGVKQSLGTLDKLKLALLKLGKSGKSDTLSGISKSAKSLNVDINGISKSVAALEKRFSFVGETVRAVANKARDSLVNTLGKGINFVTDSIVQGGIRRATNIEGAHFQLQALLKDEKAVHAVMDDAMDAVDGTAYGFDEAAKAASMFAASGLTAGKDMQTALKGITGVAAMTNSEFGDISMIFTQVAGQGRVLGDQLLQLSARGLNAPSTIAKYFNEVTDGTIKASKGVTKAIKELSNGAKVTEGDIREMVSDSKISFNIFAEAMGSAFGDSAKKANETFNGSLANMKAALSRIGAEFVSPLIAQNSQVVKLFNDVKDVVNRVKKTLTFDKEIGNTDALSKRFTDSVLGMAKSARIFVKGLDVESGMQVFFNILDSGINIVKAFASLLAPLGNSIGKVFSGLSVKDVVKFTEGLKDLTAKMTLSESASKNLEKGFDGIIDIGRLVADVIFTIIEALIPTEKQVNKTADGFFEFVGKIGKGLSTFSYFVRSMLETKKASFETGEGLNKLNGILAVGSSLWGVFTKGAKAGGKIIKEFVSVVANRFDIDSLFKKLNNINFDNAVQNIEKFEKSFESIMGTVFGGIDSGDVMTTGGIAILILFIKKLIKTFKSSSSLIEQIPKSIRNVTDTIKTLPDLFSSTSKALASFRIKNIGETFKAIASGVLMISAAISLLSLADTKKAFAAMSMLGVLAGAIMGGTYLLIQAMGEPAKPLEMVTEAFSKSITNLTKAVKTEALGKTILSIGAAIALISGSLVAIALTYEQNENSMLFAAIAVASMVGVIAGIMTLINVLSKKLKVGPILKVSISAMALAAALTLLVGALIDIYNVKLPSDYGVKNVILLGMFAALTALVVVLNKTSKKSEKGKISAITLAGLCLVMMTMVKAVKDVYAMELPSDYGVKNVILLGMFAALLTFITVMNKTATKGKQAKTSVTTLIGLCLVLLTMLKAVKDVYAMELPSDYLVKSVILVGMMGGLMALILAINKTHAKGTKQAKTSVTTLIGLCLVLLTMLKAVKAVYAMELPSDYLVKSVILVGMMGGLMALILVVSDVSKKAKGAIKTVSILLSLCITINTIVNALKELSDIPGEQMLVGVIGLTAVLTAMLGGLKIMTEISKKGSTSIKTTLSMTLLLNTIASSLSKLSDKPIENMAVSAAALIATLLSTAKGMNMISNTSNTAELQNVLSMVGIIGAISVALYVLSEQPWEGIISAGAALSVTSISLAFALSTMSNTKIDAGTVIGFVASAIGLIPMGVALSTIASQPWDGILAATIALNATALVLAACLALISNASVNPVGIVGFVAGAIALIPISAALKMLAGENWSKATAGAIALNATAAVLAACLMVVSSTVINPVGIVGFVAGAIALIPISAALKMLAGENWSKATAGAIALNATAAILAVCLALVSALVLNPVGILAFVAGAVALIPIASAIKTLAGLQWEDVSNGLKSLAAALIIIGAAGAVGLVIAPGLLALSVALVAFSAAMVTTGVGIVAFTTSLNLAVGQLQAFLTTIGNLPSFAEMGRNMMQGLINGIVEGVSGVFNAVKEVAGGVIDTVCDVLGIHSPSEIFKALGINVDEGFSLGLEGGASGIDSSMQSVFGTLTDKVDLSAFTGKGGEAAEGFGAGLLGGEGGITDVMGQVTDPSGIDLSMFTGKGGEASGNFGEGMLGGDMDIQNVMNSVMSGNGLDLTSFMTKGQEASGNFGQGVSKGESSVKDITKKTMDVSQVDLASYQKLGRQAAEKFIQSFQSGAKTKVPGAAKNIANTLQKALQNSIQGADYNSIGIKAINQFATGLKSGANTATSAAKQVANEIANTIKQQKDVFKVQGNQNMLAYATGLKSGQGQVSNVVKTMANTIANSFKTNDTRFRKSGSDNLKAYDEGLKNKTKTCINTTKQMVTTIIKGFNSKVSDFKNSGSKSGKAYVQGIEKAVKSGASSLQNAGQSIAKNFVQGVAKGINANSGLAKNAAKKLAQQIDQQVKSTLEIHSPSKKGEERGKQYDQGIAKGIEGNSGMVTKAAEEMADKLDKSLQNAIDESNNQRKGPLSIFEGQAEEEAARRAHVGAEMKYWADLLNIKQQGADGEKYIGMNIIEFRRSIEEQEKEIRKSYKEQIAAERESMSQQLDMWSEANMELLRTKEEQAKFAYEQEKAAEDAKKKAKKSKDETSSLVMDETKSITENLKDQTKIYNTYAKEMQKAKKKFKNTNVYAEIVKMGVDQLPLLKELNQMTGDELDEFYKAFDARAKAVNNSAKQHLGAAAKETKDQLNQLYEIGTEGAAQYQALQANGLAQEQSYWDKLLSIKKFGAEQEKYQDMEMADFRKSILEETQKILDDYTNQFEQTRNNIMTQMDLFTEVEEKQAKTKDELVSIMKSQVDAYQAYADVLQSLSTRLQGTQLLDYLKDLGVGSLGELQSINSMTDEELSEYAGLYDEKLAIAGQAATTKMAEIQKETEANLKDLFGVAADVDLTEFRNKFDGTLESIEQYLIQLQEPIKEAPEQVALDASNIIKALSEGLSNGTISLKTGAKRAASTVVSAMTQKLKEGQSDSKRGGEELAKMAVNGIDSMKSKFQNSGKQSGSSYTSGVKNKYGESTTTGQGLANKAVSGINSRTSSFQTAGQTQGSSYANALSSSSGNAREAGDTVAYQATEGINNRSSEFYWAGQNAGQGFVDGLESKVSAAEAAGKKLANAASSSTKKSLNEHSPSKVMARIGTFAGSGFVGGLLKMVSQAVVAGKKLGESSAEATESAYKGISLVQTDDLFQNPIITPTVDLTNVREATRDIVSMFNKAVKSVGIDMSSLNESVTKQKQTREPSKTSTETKESGSQVINNNFTQNNYSPKALSSIDIYRRTNNQFKLFERTVQAQ